MQYPWAVSGAKVICIKDGKWNTRRAQPPNPPKFMQQYTIKAVANRRYFLGIKLLETPTGWYAAQAFRPLETIDDLVEQTEQEFSK